jgi:hypothetical protein
VLHTSYLVFIIPSAFPFFFTCLGIITRYHLYQHCPIEFSAILGVLYNLPHCGNY